MTNIVSAFCMSASKKPVHVLNFWKLRGFHFTKILRDEFSSQHPRRLSPGMNWKDILVNLGKGQWSTEDDRFETQKTCGFLYARELAGNCQSKKKHIDIFMYAFACMYVCIYAYTYTMIYLRAHVQIHARGRFPMETRYVDLFVSALSCMN
jgi:hypothetical protein